MLIINKPRLPPIHLNRPTAAFEPDSAAPRLVLRLQWACFGGLVGRLGLLMIKFARSRASFNWEGTNPEIISPVYFLE